MPAPQEERNKLDEQMMRNVRRATRDAEAVLFLVDAGVRPEDAAPLLQPYCNKGLPVAVVLNKVRPGVTFGACESFDRRGAARGVPPRVFLRGTVALRMLCACCTVCAPIASASVMLRYTMPLLLQSGTCTRCPGHGRIVSRVCSST